MGTILIQTTAGTKKLGSSLKQRGRAKGGFTWWAIMAHQGLMFLPGCWWSAAQSTVTVKIPFTCLWGSL